MAPNCHVRIDRNQYSSPVRYVSQSVDASRGERMLEEFLERGRERIAVYPRQTGRNRLSVRQITCGQRTRCRAEVYILRPRLLR